MTPQTSLAGEPLSPLERDQGDPVRVAELAEGGFCDNEVLLNVGCISSCASHKCLCAGDLRPEERRDLARRTDGHAFSQQLAGLQVADLDCRLDRNREGVTNHFMRKAEAALERELDRGASDLEGATVISSGEDDRRLGGRVHPSILHVVALFSTHRDVPAGGVDMATKRLDMSEPEVDALSSWKLLVARLQELGPEFGGFVEATRIGEDVHEVACGLRHSLLLAPSAGRRSAALACVSRPGRSPRRCRGLRGSPPSAARIA